MNKALHIAALVRMRICDETRSYVRKRTAEGRTRREIRRQVKRYLTRNIHRILTRENAFTLPA